jgi:hypothetical protein
VASRREEKERRRREREEAERALARQEARRRRIGTVLAAVLGTALVAVVVLVVTAGDGGSGGGGEGVAAPAFGRGEDLPAAARAAGCRVSGELPDEGREHVAASQPVRYRTNPPTSGPHDEVAARDGNYIGVEPPGDRNAVHSLEHGRVNVQYRRGTPQARLRQLEGMFNEELNGIAGYKTLIFENRSMRAAVAATGWRRMITCDRLDDRTFDAIRAFRRQFVDQGPEQGIPHGA